VKPLLDRILNWGISKKLTVYVICTYSFFADKITPEQYIQISLMYIGTQGVIDLWNKIKK